MGVIFSTGYTPYTEDSGALLLENGDDLLLESGFRLLLDFPAYADLPTNRARIAHALNWLGGGTITASSTAAGYFAEAPDNSLTYERWKPSSLPASWEYYHTSAAECDYCCIGAHTLGTNGNTLQVQYWDGAWQDLIPATVITDNSDIFVIFPRQSRRRWRINITNGTAPLIGVVKFGLALQMERPLYGGHAPMEFARNVVLKMNESETGEFLGRSKYRTYNETNFSWSNLSASWIRQNWGTFQRATELEPFFIAWRPGGFSEVAFGRLMAPAIPSNSGTRDLMSVEVQMRARSYD